MAAPLTLEPAELPADAVEVGRIADAWGVKGWFKVVSHSTNPEALFAAKRWYLQPSERGAKTFSGTVLLQIRQAKDHSDTVVAWAQGIDDRDAAQALRGARIFVPRSSFPVTTQDEYYWVDLIGLQVVNREGVALGPGAGNDVHWSPNRAGAGLRAGRQGPGAHDPVRLGVCRQGGFA
jgi:16S rRNA processing protein RimM